MTRQPTDPLAWNRHLAIAEVLIADGLVIVPYLAWNARARRPGKAPLANTDGTRVECETIDQLRPWLRRQPNMNLAVLGLAQVDADDDASQDLARDLGVTSDAAVWIIRTARGWRALYRVPEGRRLTAVTKNGDPKADPLIELDLLVNVPAIIPPSRHPSGAFYQWVPGHTPFDIALPQLVEPPPLILDHWHNITRRDPAPLQAPATPQSADLTAAVMAFLVPYSAGIRNPNRNGWTDGIRCPFIEAHARHDQDPSFGVNLTLGVWKCWSHGESGSLRSLAETFGIVAPRRYRQRAGAREVRMPVTREATP